MRATLSYWQAGEERSRRGGRSQAGGRNEGGMQGARSPAGGPHLADWRVVVSQHRGDLHSQGAASGASGAQSHISLKIKCGLLFLPL